MNSAQLWITGTPVQRRRWACAPLSDNVICALVGPHGEGALGCGGQRKRRRAMEPGGEGSQWSGIGTRLALTSLKTRQRSDQRFLSRGVKDPDGASRRGSGGIVRNDWRCQSHWTR